MEKKYTITQKLVSAFCNENVEWHYATEVEKLVMRYNSLSEDEKKDFLKKIANEINMQNIGYFVTKLET